MKMILKQPRKNLPLKLPKLPTLDFETRLWQQGYDLVIGIDEVGRGAFAGPVTAAAVAFKPFCLQTALVTIADSKQLNSEKRAEAAKWIKLNCLASAIASASVKEIDQCGIGEATKKAMRRAVKIILNQTIFKNHFFLIDGFHVKYLNPAGLKKQLAIKKGDLKVYSIAAASIIAKVYRDNLMQELAQDFLNYSWEKNKGYGTENHREAIKKYGLTKHHRRSYNLSSLR